MKTLFSVHIPFESTEHKIIIDDIYIYNSVMHNAFKLCNDDHDVLKTKKEQDLPDLRLKENRGLKDNTPPSIHMQLKETYGLNDYFTNSALMEGKAALKSAKELQKEEKKEKKAILKQVKEKLNSVDKRLKEFLKTKECLIKYSRWEKEQNGRKPVIRMPKGSTEVLDKETMTVSIWHYDKRKRKRTKVRDFKSLYLFETQYLDKKIKEFKARKNSLENRILRIEHQLKKLDKKPSVCFGTKKLFQKQFTKFKDKHKEWYLSYNKKRNKSITISGRKDSINGNYVFRYDPETKVLYYKSMKGKVVEIPGVWFPYGQFLLEQYIAKQKTDKYAPIGWSIERWGRSFIIKCMLTLPDTDTNYYYGNGCIGMDVNADCLALCETDKNGNLIHHKILPFNLENKSSEQAEHILSGVLEEVFKYCFEKKKPLVIEDLKDVAETSVYGHKALNRTLSSFAHTKIKKLVFSKSWKYQTDVKAVNPAYTSQIGKIKYMRRYGLSVHEAASLAIARRGMGFKEYLPSIYKRFLPDDRTARHHWSHWAYMYKYIFKEIRPSECYIKNFKITTA